MTMHDLKTIRAALQLLEASGVDPLEASAAMMAVAAVPHAERHGVCIDVAIGQAFGIEDAECLFDWGRVAEAVRAA